MRSADATTVVGVDEAGRGAWIGPLVVGAVAVRADQVPDLADAGACDSKALSAAEREEVYRRLERWARLGSVELPPSEIDRSVRRHALNRLEAEAFGRVARPFAPALVRVDACDANAARFGREVAAHGGPGLRVVARHHADADDPLVGAASIVAKVRRDRTVRDLAEQLGEEVGSGYPSDPTTVEFVRSFARAHPGPLPPWLRASWATTQRVIGARPPRTLESLAP